MGTALPPCSPTALDLATGRDRPRSTIMNSIVTLGAPELTIIIIAIAIVIVIALREFGWRR
jgi:hypothetical protein